MEARVIVAIPSPNTKARTPTPIFNVPILVGLLRNMCFILVSISDGRILPDDVLGLSYLMKDEGLGLSCSLYRLMFLNARIWSLV